VIREGTTLGERMSSASARALGAEEHLQIALLFRKARQHVVDRDAAEAVRRSLNDHTWSVESNLDLLPKPDGPVWFEWPLPTRSGRGGGDIARTGCLVCPEPNGANYAVVVTAWEAEGPPEHSYGIAVIDFDELPIRATAARRFYSKDPHESIERMMAGIGVFVPTGFADEIKILVGADGDPKAATEAAMRDATSEIPFLLALMLSLNVSGGLETREEGGIYRIVLPPARRRPGLAGVIDGFAKSRVGSFLRTHHDRAAWIRA